MHTAEGFSNPNTYKPVFMSSNGQGAHYLTAADNTYYVAIDCDHKIQAFPAAKIDHVS